MIPVRTIGVVDRVQEDIVWINYIFVTPQQMIQDALSVASLHHCHVGFVLMGMPIVVGPNVDIASFYKGFAELFALYLSSPE